jgi:hypothetical protein
VFTVGDDHVQAINGATLKDCDERLAARGRIQRFSDRSLQK